MAVVSFHAICENRFSLIQNAELLLFLGLGILYTKQGPKQYLGGTCAVQKKVCWGFLYRQVGTWAG